MTLDISYLDDNGLMSIIFLVLLCSQMYAAETLPILYHKGIIFSDE